VLLRVLGIAADVPILLPIGAAATAAVTTPAGIAMVSSNFLVRGKVRDLLFLIGSLDAVVGIVALQLTYSLYRPSLAGSPAGGGSLLYAVAATALGLVLGIVFTWLMRRRPQSEELVLYVLGACAFTAGAALQWGLSPLFLAAVMGFTVANLGRDRARIFILLQRWEKPVYLIFLLLAGALLRIPTVWIFVLAAAYALLRAMAKILGAAVVVAAVPLGFDVPRRLGIGLIPQGGISIAMAVSGVLLYSDLEVRGLEAETALFTVIVVGVMLSELAGPLLTVRLLRRAGEISPRVEEAIAAGDERRAEREALRHASRRPPP
jgi:Kef-type K+ transport system membrane component KefB